MAVLGTAQDRGLLGPGPVEAQIRHAEGFARAVATPPGGRCVDLGTGGGIPGLVLAARWPASRWILLDSRTRSVTWAREAVSALDLADRVVVVAARAEEAGRRPDLRGSAALVVARGFGPPSPTAECAAPLLVPGGLLVVSEPPGSDGSRWAGDGPDLLGLRFEGVVRGDEGGYARLVAAAPCPPRFPRRVGVPAKRHLW